jgi:hypothetical protein
MGLTMQIQAGPQATAPEQAYRVRTGDGRFGNGMPTNDGLRAFCGWFGITVQAAELLTILHELQGERIAVRAITERLSTSFSCVYVQIHKLKAAMECEAIDFGLGGYSLTEIGMAECDGALKAMLEVAA